MHKTLAGLMAAAVIAIAPQGRVTAQDLKVGAAPNDLPFVFAGIRYGASIEDAMKRFGQPTRIESVGASEKLFWANDQLEVSFNKKTRLISSFTVNGPLGVSAVKRVDNEPLLWLLTLSQHELTRQLGKPAKIWYEDRRMSWNYEIDSKISAAVFFECLNGSAKPCSQLSVYWTGTAIWDPDDGVDASGLRVNPICARTTSATKILAKQLPTGVTASTENWEMELYENSENGSWTLIGKSKAERAPTSGRYCSLAKGDQARSYADSKWYRAYFKRQTVALERRANAWPKFALHRAEVKKLASRVSAAAHVER